jgi:hypothetical protein
MFSYEFSQYNQSPPERNIRLALTLGSEPGTEFISSGLFRPQQFNWLDKGSTEPGPGGTTKKRGKKLFKKLFFLIENSLLNHFIHFPIAN